MFLSYLRMMCKVRLDKTVSMDEKTLVKGYAVSKTFERMLE